ncbi:MAG: hypothetical protein A3G51_03520 [Candidatus Yanofskybacteria bacterium RIFCSPLOWO2_12_FULL_43_11b]|uniref:Peptidoglycan binding-like domain-containing protein n=2 Tax=Parcubacteria group TaxID=1794811 RepID=A0A1G2RPT4_9BACT|nr:MAG: hypothetical protein A2742_02180 [Candidatus Yanofskybacteria bacterium RIFCSPHIGHO2_01_FULL_43_32]OGN11810.1 MAG: hypothetical protein A3C69_00415 [Candidatus Yanofskybacteria bacterium RIFCSPHIGHO2_02_FULL_43_12]OGN34427.1 MAG: hypothetical protein A3G51_03520 [Candidatus Yanofskybacteria bacterium RIFCSPLOWO2_12_FULL_43_11b]OHA74853.1 MAG: hypothetical protein A3A32_03320 [Candidatus Wildermuthbacteria bacterium RIFCSPLOWO2_01_FULL_48_35]
MTRDALFKLSKRGTVAGFIFISALMGGFFVAAPASAATINVPADYSTIQAAIDAASNGDTISVAAGTYSVPDYANRIIINKELHILGVSSATSIIECDASITTATSGACVTVQADNVTIENVYIKTLGSDATERRVLDVALKGSAIDPNLLYNNFTLLNSHIAATRRAGFVGGSNMTFQGNIIDLINGDRNSFQFSSVAGTTLIESNTFNGGPSGKAAMLFEGLGAGPFYHDSIRILNNISDSHSQFALFNMNALSNVDILIQGNSVDHQSGNGSSVILFGLMSASGFNSFHVDQNTFTNNNDTRLAVYVDYAYGGPFEPADDFILVTDNTFNMSGTWGKPTDTVHASYPVGYSAGAPAGMTLAKFSIDPPSAITINSATIVLDADADLNGIVNIGDGVLVEVNLDNDDGGCADAGTTVTADLRKYGGYADAVLYCTEDNGGTGDVFSANIFVADAGAFGIDVAGAADASKVTLTYGDNDDAPVSIDTGALTEAVDTIAPAFGDTDPLQIFKQDGDDPATVTTVWYYYDGDSFRMRVTAAAESDGNPLASVKVCLAGVNDDDPEYECSTEDFDTDDYYATFGLVDLPDNDIAWELNESIGYFPETSGGYVMNIELTDDVGNMTVSALPAQMFVAAFGIDPKQLNGALNNDATTDWSAISDFTDVPELVFSAHEYDEELDEYTDIEIGRLTLGNAENHINLTDQATITGLSNFGTNLTISGEEIRIDSSALEALNLPAELRMRVDTANRPGLVVKGNDGTVRGYVSNNTTEEVSISWNEEICDEEENCELAEYSHTLGGFSWDGESQTLIFTTTGFSEFETDNDPPTVSALGNGSEDYVIPSGSSVGMTFSERLSAAGKTAVENAISAGADHEPGGYEWSDDSGLTITGNAEFDITFANDVIADVADAVGNEANNLLFIDSAFDEGQQEGGADVETDTDGDEIVILDDDAANGITIPEGVDDVTINVNNLIGDDGNGVLPEITISAATSVGNVTVSIPDEVTVSGGAAWSGIINAPTVKANDSVSGVDGTVESVIEVGFGNTELTFNKGIRIIIEGKAGKRIGYSHGGPFTEITSTCADDSQTTGDALAAGADCKIDVGSDLAVWTKHFSSFAVFTASVPSPTPVVSGGGGGGGGSWTPPVSTPAPVPSPTPSPQVLPASKKISPTPNPNVPFLFSRNLYLGLQGEDVKSLQELLTRKGVYTGPVTGYFGSLTQSAVKAYQLKYGILATGYVGPVTISSLNTISISKAVPAASKPQIAKNSNGNLGAEILTQFKSGKSPVLPVKFSRYLRFGLQGEDVKSLQELLTREGVYTGPVTGYFGSLTLAGVKAYQTRYGIPATGYVGPLTLSSINILQSSFSPIASSSEKQEPLRQILNQKIKSILNRFLTSSLQALIGLADTFRR